MIGTILNSASIVAGGVLGLTVRKELPPSLQARLKLVLAVFTVYAGLSMAWAGFNGSLLHRVAQFGIALVALSLGKVTGRLLHLQRSLNGLGQIAQRKFTEAKSQTPRRMAEGFVTCSSLFCLAPIALLGALQEGLLGSFRTLAVKSALDGLATMAFAKVFGWGVILAAIPVLAYQGSITVAARLLEPHLRAPDLLESISLTAGLLVFCLALIILELRKVAVADYLPGLVYAPLLTWLCFLR